jgi:septal ring factor EnvC (AmiA/AmiB activator)
MRYRSALVVVLPLALGAATFASTAVAQRGPGAPTANELRASIARLELQRQQLRSEATRKDAERRELEQQLERVRRDQQVLEQQLSGTDQQIRELEQALLQPR